MIPALSVRRWVALPPHPAEHRRRAALGFLVLSAYFLASWEARPLFFSNQNTYFLQGLRLAGVEGLQDDWLSQTRAPHIAFTWIVAALQSLDVLEVGVAVIEVVLYLGLVWALWSLSGCHRRPPARSAGMRFLICGVLLALMTEPGPWRRLFSWGGLAQQYLYGGYLQPGEFGIAILMAVALLGAARYRLSVGCLVVAATLHASYLVPCSLLAVLVAADLVYRKRRRDGLLVLAAFMAGVSPVVIYGLSFGGDAATTARASALLAREIIPQHAWPALWLSSDQMIRIVVMAVGSLTAWRYFGRAVALAMTGSLVLVVLGTAYVYVSEDAYAALLFPWRASTYLYPLSLLCLLVAGATTAYRLASRVAPERMDAACTWGALLLGAILIAESARELTMPTPVPEFPFAVEVSGRTGVNDQIIIPLTDRDIWNRFRLLTQRPVFVDRKSHPYLAAEVLEWKRRVDAVNELYRLAPEQRRRRCRDMGASFYVEAPEDASGADGTSGTPALSLVSCA